ncbi:hypothetical protein JCM10908_000668 [Rhodotorula pacifica]|uniref:uncharacterized protein n=1 Tax=Rhodotorula pacifica TaxID=1495444 RepID=UPI00317128D5
MPRTASKPSLAAWLHSYDPTTSLDRLAAVLAGDDDLCKALEAVQERGRLDRDEAAQAQRAAHNKVENLRTALSSLTSRLGELTDRLALAEANLAEERSRSRTLANQHTESTLAAQALATVWETRWREERRAREAAETSLRVLLAPSSSSSSAAEGCLLNGDMASGTSITVRAGPDHTSQDNLVAHLRAENAELERSKTEQLAGKELQIARLEADITVRRDELQRLCASVDSLLGLGIPATARATDNINATPSNARPASRSQRQTSVLQHPSVQAAAQHSHSREYLTTASLSSPMLLEKVELASLPPQVATTLALEEEVRELERQIALLDENAPLVAPSSPHPAMQDDSNAGSAATAQATRQPNGYSVRRPLPLRPGEHPNAGGTIQAVTPPRQGRDAEQADTSRLKARIYELESECRRLSDSLLAAERDCTALRSQLDDKDRTFDSLSQRVHDKLLDQKHKLLSAQAELELLRQDLQESEKERFRLEDWIRDRLAAPPLARAAVTATRRDGSSGEEGTGRPGSVD